MRNKIILSGLVFISTIFILLTYLTGALSGDEDKSKNSLFQKGLVDAYKKILNSAIQSNITVLYDPAIMEVLPLMKRSPSMDYDFIGTKWYSGITRDRLWIKSKRIGPRRNRFTYGNLFSRDEHEGSPGGYVYLKISANMKVGAELISYKKDYSFGRYEARIKPSGIPGCVNAFFIMDPGKKEEIDIEFLTSEFGQNSGIVHFVLHPHKDIEKENYHRIVKLDFNPSREFHTYGFIWTEEKIDYIIDERIVTTFKRSNGAPVKAVPGRIHMNAWTGNPEWGGGPPLKNAIMVVDWVRHWPANK